MAACKKSKKCKGVVYLKKSKVYRVIGGTKKVKKTGVTLKQKTSEVKSAYDHSWTVYSDKTLTGDIQSHSSLAAALLDCSGSEDCNGVTAHVSYIYTRRWLDGLRTGL